MIRGTKKLWLEKRTDLYPLDGFLRHLVKGPAGVAHRTDSGRNTAVEAEEITVGHEVIRSHLWRFCFWIEALTISLRSLPPPAHNQRRAGVPRILTFTATDTFPPIHATETLRNDSAPSSWRTWRGPTYAIDLPLQPMQLRREPVITIIFPPRT